jgi:hypothetical protein
MMTLPFCLHRPPRLLDRDIAEMHLPLVLDIVEIDLLVDIGIVVGILAVTGIVVMMVLRLLIVGILAVTGIVVITVPRRHHLLSVPLLHLLDRLQAGRNEVELTLTK